jgi:hypothetical protein
LLGRVIAARMLAEHAVNDRAAAGLLARSFKGLARLLADVHERVCDD